MMLEQINMPITFGNLTNYRTETLMFEVVGFHVTYHMILGRPYYAKFMAIPNYTYLKLNMLGPRGVIIIGTSFQHAYECEVECYVHATIIVAPTKLTIIQERTIGEPLDSKHPARSFELAKGIKEIAMDPSSPNGKVLWIGTTLSSK
ncbi:uncharacterized protein [Miscanthus floridulus]|uniref:uncharacterized protein n=1 Tax=Miscanthus floridulus TaxID=154761 RepID=UPI00345A60DF